MISESSSVGDAAGRRGGGDRMILSLSLLGSGPCYSQNSVKSMQLRVEVEGRAVYLGTHGQYWPVSSSFRRKKAVSAPRPKSYITSLESFAFKEFSLCPYVYKRLRVHAGTRVSSAYSPRVRHFSDLVQRDFDYSRPGSGIAEAPTRYSERSAESSSCRKRGAVRSSRA